MARALVCAHAHADADARARRYIVRYYELEETRSRRRLEAGGLGSAAGSRVDATLELTGAQSSAVDECESLSLPDDADGLRGLMDEAEFFQLGELQHKCAEALDLLQLRRVDPRAGSGGVAGAWPPPFMLARSPPPSVRGALILQTHLRLPPRVACTQLRSTRVHGAGGARAGGPGRTHATIAEAVAAAEEGERIVIAGGDYPEALVFAKSVTLLAAPGARVTVSGLPGREATVCVKHGSVLLCDLELTCSAGERPTDVDPPAAAEQGGGGRAGKQAGGEQAGRGGSCCVLVLELGLVLLERCQVRQPAADYGIFLHQGGRANLKHTLISGCRGTGLGCTGGSVTMEQCTVEKSGGVGVILSMDGVATVRRCTVAGNGDCGVVIQDVARGTWTGNEIHSNALAGAMRCRCSPWRVRVEAFGSCASF